MDEELFWTQAEAISLCRILEPIAANHGFHVALAGGCLHQVGRRPDLDVVLYRHDGSDNYDVKGCLRGFQQIGVSGEMEGTWYFRAQFNAKKIEFMFMERVRESS